MNVRTQPPSAAPTLNINIIRNACFVREADTGSIVRFRFRLFVVPLRRAPAVLVGRCHFVEGKFKRQLDAAHERPRD